MHNTSTGELSATAIDGYEPSSVSAKILRSRFKNVLSPMPDEASPRGISTSPTGSRAALDGLLAAGAEICFRGTVLPRHVCSDGRADDGFALSVFTDAVPHVWQKTPMTHAYMSERNLGRVAVEMKLTWVSPLKSGDMFVIVSAPTSVNSKTMNIRHHLYESQTKRLSAICDVVALVMDLETRKSVALPEEAAKRIPRLILD
ncbi:thioesterase family protein [Roseibium sp. H3510]|uniref:Thioesterase family protein n=2 Tax=Roseibium algae TaxID=3123038 RepID=A0ABU8TGP6_9HYPH